MAVHNLRVRELESPSNLGRHWRTFGELASHWTDMGFKRSELNLSDPAFPQFNMIPLTIRKQARTPPALRKDTHLGSVQSCRSLDRELPPSGGFGNEHERQTLKDTEGHWVALGEGPCPWWRKWPWSGESRLLGEGQG